MKPMAVIPAIAALSACAPEPLDPVAYRNTVVEQYTDTRFGVKIEAVNVDGYELARCIAAAYTANQVDKEGNRLYEVFVREGGKITDEFRRVEGERQQTARGIQTFFFATPKQFAAFEHDGRNIMAVDRQLAACETKGLPTTVGDGL